MRTLTHTSPLGDLEIPTVGIVPAGEPFEVDDDIAGSLLEQTDLYHDTEAPKPGSLAALRAEAATAGIDTTGMKKSDILAALAAPTEGN